MSAQGAAAVTGAAAENADEIAKAASDSTKAVFDSSGVNILLVVGALGVAYWMFKITEVTEDVTDGVGDAGEAVGETAGDAYEGTQDMVSDGADWALGGTADAAEDAGDVFQEAW
jgi:hypothetical protein